MRITVNAAIIDERKILLVRKGNYWILPGGKPELGETDLECLAREVDEELSGTVIKNIEYYGTFFGKAPHRKDDVGSVVYFAEIDGELFGPSGEIDGAEWVEDSDGYCISDITRKVIMGLVKDDYLE